MEEKKSMFNFLSSASAGAGQVILTIIVIIFLVVLIVFLSSIRIVHQAEAKLIERFGQYHTTWNTGFHMLFPFVDKVKTYRTYKGYGVLTHVSLKEQLRDFDPQPVITKDNVTMEIDTVVYFQITDPKLYTYNIENPELALENLTATTLRNIIGELELDEALTSRDLINSKMRLILDEATDPWGIKVIRVEVKNILPPKDIRDAMEKQMRAERERREAILLAEGEKRAAILKAEGVKEASILQAEAKKEALIREAEGQAQAILAVNEATAKGLEMIKNVSVDKGVLTLKAYEALQEMSKGQATKIIIPSELQSLAGLIVSAKELLTEEKKTTGEKKETK
jgi:regulator of protease activity HflC (stomatin/prohibitin superfamily)